MHRFFKYALYSIYLIVAAGLFLYIQFPSETMIRYLSASANASYPGIRITMANMHPTLPLGVAIASGAVFYHDIPLVRADRIRLRPMLLSILKPERKIRFLGAAHAGRFNGVIEWAADGRPAKYRVDAGLSGMQIHEIPLLQHLSGKRVSGKCDGRIEYRSDGDAATVRINAVDCKIARPSLTGKEEFLSFQQVLATLAVESGGLNIKELLFKGRQVDGRLSGAIALRKPIGKSVMTLSGEMKPHPGFFTELGHSVSPQLLSSRIPGESTMPFTIEGTLEDPVFSF